MRKNPSTSALVGRASEIELVRDAISALDTGTGQVLLFAGEPGIGKSTLARGAAEIARSQGASVYWGFCWEAGGAPSYWPWTQLLRSLLADHELSESERASLALLLPEFSDDGEGGQGLQPDQARFMLLDSVRLILARIAGQGPMVLVFEDLHAADKDSLNLLRHIARHVSSMPVLVIATYREIEARSSANSEPLWQLGRDADVLNLRRLTPLEVAEFIGSRTGTTPDKTEVGRWFETTSGNPLFLSELVGLLDSADAGPATGKRLPATVEQVLGQQIDRLPQDTVRLLSIASILGKSFQVEALASIAPKQQSSLEDLLESAAGTGVIVPTAAGAYEFSHGLYRDVLYAALSREDRTSLHLQYARALKKRVAQGDADGWSELAGHFAAAGIDHRGEAIEAWRHAADRAAERLAFDDAASLLTIAVDTFGEGPKFDPSDRCRLLLDCAAAMLLAGDIEGGHARCSEAFAIARTLEDTELMATAALVYGRAIVVASVDPVLVNMLEDCLAALPKADLAMRARVQARLAAALQPAEDPAGPMAMAREAIGQARVTGDRAVLYDVLRSAISALMDFAPPTERRALNQEFLGLATESKDAPAQFRSHLRLMIDASELADRKAFDAAIDACERIAERIGLPHYQWRAASAKAMQAIIEGRYADASLCLDHAQSMADQIEDLEPHITIPIQRFAIKHDWDSERATTLEDIQAQLDGAYAQGMGEARAFVQPFLAAFTVTDRDEARKLIENPLFIRRTLAGSDRFSMVAAGLLAQRADDSGLTQAAFDSLLEFKQQCAGTGLMGGVWCGPIALELGRLALTLGRVDEAGPFLATALEMAERMNARPFVARIHHELSRLAVETGDSAASAKHAQTANELVAALEMRPIPGLLTAPPLAMQDAVPGVAAFAIKPKGEVCEVSLNGRAALVKNSKGLEMLLRLIKQPDTDIHALDLSGAGSGAAVADSDAGPALDPRARADYRRRVGELKEEMDEAEELADASRLDSLRKELDFITSELSRAFGLGGRERPQGKAAERARVNVRRRIKDAIERIEEQLPGAGRYLENTIKTGSYCRYSPM